MNKEEVQKIFAKLVDHDARLKRLENKENLLPSGNIGQGSKQKTIREIVKGRKFQNGQQQIAVIVGYNENILGTLINRESIKTEWNSAKMTNKYNKTFIDRAEDEYIRIQSDGKCDLTQTGETFFDNFIKNESTDSTSK